MTEKEKRILLEIDRHIDRNPEALTPGVIRVYRQLLAKYIGQTRAGIPRGSCPESTPRPRPAAVA